MKATLFIILALGTSLFGSDLNVLQDKYNTAANKALEPINKVYIQELQKLLEKESKNGNLETVTQITDELKKFEVKKEKLNKNPASDFINQTWVSNLGTMFVFNKDGSGTKEYFKEKTLISWKIIDNGFVEVSDKGNIRYFKFSNKKQGFYGEAIDKLDKSLTSR